MHYGFKLIEERFIKEIDSMGRVFIHEKSGARLLHIENKDDNKVFSISFRTPPQDNTGLTHILEHSVLCGSRRFPTKEPFVDLAKGSLNTFLNAMTFADKTMYPVASKNEKDFLNLMDVYMDAVLYPNIYKYPEIFMQEGWHHEIGNVDEEITYKGVVYNEMLGAFSSPEEILYSRVMESLYPDTSYGFESGGDPDYIPDLTYNDFLEYHGKYYHPSNSYIYLYGNMNLDEQLKFLDEKYLCDFDKRDINSKLCAQKPFTERKESVLYYPVTSRDEEVDGTYFTLNYVIGNACDKELCMAFNILEYVLLETPASPLKKALIDSEIGKDVMGHFDDGILEPMFNIVLKDSNECNKAEFVDIVNATLKDLLENGIDKKLIEAGINSMEFKLREADGDDTPKGLLYGIRAMDSWIYDENPFMHLEYEATLNKIKERAYSGYFERLIKEYLMDNTHSTLLTMLPKYGLSEEKSAALKEKLGDYKKSLGEEGLNRLINVNKRLWERQTTPDSIENLEKIPIISIEDINSTVELPPIEEREEAGVKVIYHNVPTNKIVYMGLLFDTSSVEQGLLPYLSLLTDVMGMVDTKKLKYTELSNEIDIHTGGIEFMADVYEEVNGGLCHPKFIAESKALSHKMPDLMNLLDEIINGSKFRSKKRLKEIIVEIKSDLEMDIIDEGHAVAVKRLCSYFSYVGYYNEIMTGISYFNFIKELEGDFNKKYDDIVKNLRNVCENVFNRQNLIVTLTCQEKEYEQFKDCFPQFVDKLGSKNPDPVDYVFDYFPKNEGLYTSGNVQHVAKGYNYRELGYEYNGYMQVLKNILSLDYLWNRVRVQGGAYGAFVKLEMGGNTYFVSYRDPNLKETLEVFDDILKYIGEFDISEREMKKYIIGTISNLDQPLTPAQMGHRSDEYYFRKITKEALQRERNEVLNTKPEDIRKFKELLSDVISKNYICVVGSESVIKGNESLFDKMTNISN